MRIDPVPQQERLCYRELLLLADEQMDMVERYLWRGEMFRLLEGDARGILIITREGPDLFEVKSLAVSPSYQRRGYGRTLLEFAASYCRSRGGRLLEVGTGESPATLGFYEACGFRRTRVVKNFFTDHYDHPIYDGGVLLRDMVYLRRML